MSLITQRGARKEYRDSVTGREYFSISQIRKVLDDSYRNANPRDLEAARIRGNALHLRFALATAAKSGLCPYPDVIPAYAGHCRQMDRWIEAERFVPIKIEEPAACEKDGFAGTPENLLKFHDGTLRIVDLKTGAKTKTDAVQLMLNKRLAGYEAADVLMDLYLSGEGKPSPVEQRFDPFAYAAAFSALNVLKWQFTQ